ncbi:SxtJ family membrane protein [Magnetospirillum sp. UT-4]|uniref:SxtJ family membrane protein n=1 Tax=Magnetospirillum sp. UT-4 TaxID=2681467 RepID=UPI001382B89E|nr:SxtJ family membrane protein [Magnetospirillum sp. UT-4]CAA7621781.1 conserved membrane hypothetical protein [Magnetospirillum sp. UT-4]
MVARQTNRAFGLTFTAVFAMIAAVGFLAFDVVLTWAMTASAVFLALALAAPAVLLPLNRLWGRLVAGLGHVNNRLVLGLFFYAVVTPVGVLMRLAGNDPMHRRLDPAAKSYLQPVGRRAGPDTYPDLF